MLFLIIFLCFTISGALLCFFKKTRLTGKIMLFTANAVFFVFSSLYAGLLTALIHGNSVGYCITASVLLVGIFISFCIFGIIKKKKFLIPLVCIFTISLIIPTVSIVYENYLKTIPELTDRSDLLYEYRPFDDTSKVATLDKECSLKIESDPPIIDGATALYPIYSAFANATYPYSTQVLCTGTTDAYKAIADGERDIIFAAAPSDKQLEYAKEKGVELELTPIGYEAFVFFVNSKNKIDNLSLSQIKDIYSGRVTDWKELGIRGLGKIKAFQRDEGSGSQSALLRLMEGDTLTDAPQDTINSMGEIIHRTSNYKNFKNAIGFSFRFYSTEMVKNNLIKLLSIDGVYPSRENIENSTYPITDCFYMVTRKGQKRESVQKFMDWIVSEEGAELISKTGYTPYKR